MWIWSNPQSDKRAAASATLGQTHLLFLLGVGQRVSEQRRVSIRWICQNAELLLQHGLLSRRGAWISERCRKEKTTKSYTSITNDQRTHYKHQSKCQNVVSLSHRLVAVELRIPSCWFHCWMRSFRRFPWFPAWFPVCSGCFRTETSVLVPLLNTHRCVIICLWEQSETCTLFQNKCWK